MNKRQMKKTRKLIWVVIQEHRDARAATELPLVRVYTRQCVAKREFDATVRHRQLRAVAIDSAGTEWQATSPTLRVSLKRAFFNLEFAAFMTQQEDDA
ncbi:hypothetical protein [Lacticaseibacillus absianus]|uniref:hypothetical protein n=1 Tax=Lacticaseibacillus absianus TaxID=2729623 RepID=UPI0015CCE0FC|nr:hypothetical protein [Lacticaseibacillus absianus]